MVLAKKKIIYWVFSENTPLLLFGGTLVEEKVILGKSCANMWTL